MNNHKLITLNLLPPDRTSLLREHLLLLMFRELAAFSFIILAFVGMVLLGARIILLNSFNEAIAQSTLVTREYGGMNSLIRETNSRMAVLNAIEREHTPWSSALYSLAKTVPAKITLISLSADKKSRQLSIRGIAAAREDLLLFTEALKDSALFESIESPISNLLTKEELQFDLKMKLSESALKTQSSS